MRARITVASAVFADLVLTAATPAMAKSGDEQEMRTDGGDHGVTNKSSDAGDHVVTHARQIADGGDDTVTNAQCA